MQLVIRVWVMLEAAARMIIVSVGDSVALQNACEVLVVDLRTKSPPVSPPMMTAPYESIPTAKWVLDQIQNRAVYQAAASPPTTERHPRDVKADMMEGGMI
jgi:hypothetical protein